MSMGTEEVSAPAASGLSAVAGAGSDFERIWVAYRKLGNKKASRAAFEAIENPDVELIVARAASWAASAKPGQKRMPLEKWLAAEKYDEADRRVEPKATKPEPEREPRMELYLTRPAIITAARATVDGIHVTFRRDDGEEFEKVLPPVAPEMRVILAEAGLDELADTEAMLGTEVDITLRPEGLGICKPFRSSAPRPVSKRPEGGFSGMMRKAA